MKNFFFASLLAIVCLKSYAQSLDKVLFNAKLNTIQFSKVLISEEQFKEIPFFLNNSKFCQADTIFSTGFNDNYFIKIKLADLYFRELMEMDSNSMSYEKDLIYSEFILAYSKTRERFYKIKGFLENEFGEFFYDYKLSAGIIEKESLNNDKRFTKSHSISEVDLECLMKSIRSNSKSLKDYPCLIPSDSRLLFVNGMPFNR